MGKVASFMLLTVLLTAIDARGQEVDLKKYAIDAEGTISQVIPGAGILSKNTFGVFGPLHPNPSTSGKEVLETIDDKTGEHVSMYEERVPHQEVSYLHDPLGNMGRGS